MFFIEQGGKQEGKYHLLGFLTSLEEPLSIIKQNAFLLGNGVA